jgi:hypothetical protein
MVLRVALTLVLLLALLASSPTAAPKFSEWSAPENLGPIINSSATDAAPAISKEGLSLYFNSTRPGGVGANDIWVSRWDSATQAWGIPTNLGVVVNSTGIDASAALSRDEHWLFFHSNRGGGVGGLDIWASYRAHTHDDFGWQTPVNLGPNVNSVFDDTVGGYLANDDTSAPQLFMASNRPGGVGAFDIYVTELQPDGTFGPPTLVPGLNSTAPDPGLMVRFDGLEAFFYSTRPGFGATDMWTATRQTIFDLWSAPMNMGPLLNTVAIDQRPYIASDRRTLFFASDRAGGAGGLDLYVTTRARE